MAKLIYLKPNQDITSIIGYLWQTKEPEIVLVAPKNSVLLENRIALKILKREADNCEKEIIFVIKDSESREAVEDLGFKTKVSWPKSEISEEESEEEEKVIKEMPAQDYQLMIGNQLKIKHGAASKIRFSDIKKPGNKKKDSDEKIKKIKSAEESEDDFILGHLAEPEKEFSLPIPQETDDFKEKAETFLKIKNFAPREEIKEETVQEESVPFEKIFGREEKEIFIKPQIHNFSKKKFSGFKFPDFSSKIVMLFVGSAVIVAGLVFYFVLPKAEIEVVPKVEATEQDLNVVADKGSAFIDLGKGVIPAQVIRFDKKSSREFNTTGESQANEKARGVMTVYNEYSSSPQGLVEKTRFVSADGKVFRTVKSITVPGAKISEGKVIASSIDVEVAADEAGESYNISPGKFLIPGFQGSPKYEGFYGITKDAMYGGTTGISKIVSADDVEMAKNEIWADLQKDLESDIKTQTPEGLKLLPEAKKLEISSFDPSVKAGGRADKFTMTVKGTGILIFFDERDIIELARENSEIESLESKDYSDKLSEVVYSEVSADFEKSKISFKAKVGEKLVWKINDSILKRLIAGRNETEIRTILNDREEVLSARILFWPFWVDAVPDNPDRVNVSVKTD